MGVCACLPVDGLTAAAHDFIQRYDGVGFLHLVRHLITALHDGSVVALVALIQAYITSEIIKIIGEGGDRSIDPPSWTRLAAV